MRHTFQDYDSWKTNSGYEDEVRYDEPKVAGDPWELDGKLPTAITSTYRPADVSAVPDHEIGD